VGDDIVEFPGDPGTFGRHRRAGLGLLFGLQLGRTLRELLGVQTAAAQRPP
jgi:hypothetical protein